MVLVTFPTEQEHFDAVVQVLTDADANPHDYDETVTDDGYTLVSVSDRFGGTPRMSGDIGIRLARVTLLAVGITADNVREIRQRFDSALREKRLTIAGRETTPIQFETSEPVGPDGDIFTTGQWYSARSQYTYEI